VIAEGTVAEVTRRAAAPRRGRFRVPAELRERALAALAQVPQVADPQALDGRPDWFAASFEDAAAVPGMVSEAVRALARAGVPLLAFELEGARLSDAFLSMTGEDPE
jgi:ABC-2 type transport system ATP-binding protein